MGDVENLFPQVKDMTDEELREFIRSVRTDRATSKKVQKTTTKKERTKTSDKIQDILAGMSKEDRQAFLKKLIGEDE